VEIIDTKSHVEISPNELVWLTEDLKSKVKTVFEPRYGRELSEAELFEIAENLVAFIEPIARRKTGKEVVTYGK
jgi:hypothetical protein